MKRKLEINSSANLQPKFDSKTRQQTIRDSTLWSCNPFEGKCLEFSKDEATSLGWWYDNYLKKELKSRPKFYSTKKECLSKCPRVDSPDIYGLISSFVGLSPTEEVTRVSKAWSRPPIEKIPKEVLERSLETYYESKHKDLSPLIAVQALYTPLYEIVNKGQIELLKARLWLQKRDPNTKDYLQTNVLNDIYQFPKVNKKAALQTFEKLASIEPDLINSFVVEKSQNLSEMPLWEIQGILQIIFAMIGKDYKTLRDDDKMSIQDKQNEYKEFFYKTQELGLPEQTSLAYFLSDSSLSDEVISKEIAPALSKESLEHYWANPGILQDIPEVRFNQLFDAYKDKGALLDIKRFDFLAKYPQWISLLGPFVASNNIWSSTSKQRDEESARKLLLLQLQLDPTMRYRYPNSLLWHLSESDLSLWKKLYLDNVHLNCDDINRAIVNVDTKQDLFQKLKFINDCQPSEAPEVLRVKFFTDYLLKNFLILLQNNVITQEWLEDLIDSDTNIERRQRAHTTWNTFLEQQ